MNALEAVFSSVLDTSWRASCLIAFVLIVRWSLRGRLPAQLLSWVWLAVALRLLLPVSVPASWSPFNLLGWRQGSSNTANVATSLATSNLAPARSAPSDDGRRERVGSPAALLSLEQWVALIWCTGVAVLLAMRIMACAAFAQRVRRSAFSPPAAAMPPDVTRSLEEHKVSVFVTGAVSAPALHGILRPRILFPPGFLDALSASEIRLTIRHELAHVQRRDVLADLIIHVAAVVHWFNPLVWLASRAARQDCELACDESVVRLATESERGSYGAALLRLASLTSKASRPGFGLGVVASKRHIKRRIQMIIRNHAFALPGTLLGGAVFVALVGLSFTSEITAQVSATPSVTPPPISAPRAEASDIVYDATIDRLDVLFPSGVVATVLDRNITVADVRREVAPLVPRLKLDSRSQDEFNGRLAILQNSAIKNLVDRALLVRQFHDARPGEPPKQIDTEYIEKAFTDELNERFGGDRSKFLAHLKDRNMTIRDYRKAIEEQIIYNYMRGQERKIAGTTKKVMKSEAADRPIRLRIIQLSRSPGETDTSLLANADGILARLRNGEPFEGLARQFDQSGRRDQGGDWGWIGPEDMRPQFRDTIMALKKGEVSAPVIVNEGCFLLYAEDRR